MEDVVDYPSERYAPLRSARDRLESAGGWAPVRDELLDLATEANDAGEAFHVESEYLVVLGRRRKRRLTYRLLMRPRPRCGLAGR